MVSADNLYKFRSKISKNIYNDLKNTKGDLVDSIYGDLEGKVEKMEFGIEQSFIKIEVDGKTSVISVTDIINLVERNLREFISLNKDKLELTLEEESIFNEFINSCSLYEFFIVGNQLQFNL